MLSRHADVKDVVRDWQSYSNASGGILDHMKHQDRVERFRSMLTEDPPAHTLHRRMLGTVFTPRRVVELESSVRELCATFLENWGEDGYDIATELAARLPMAVIGALLGVPEADSPLITALVPSYSLRNDREEEGMRARLQLHEYLLERIREARGAPGDGLLNALANLEIADDGALRPLTDGEAENQATVLALAGNDTTHRLLGFVVDLLGKHPDQRRRLLDDPGLVANVCDEVLRLETPAHFFGRMTMRETEWHGRVVPERSILMLSALSAGHDERVFEDADAFDVGGNIGNDQLGFSGGIHYCLGAPLARLEVRAALEEM